MFGLLRLLLAGGRWTLLGIMLLSENGGGSSVGW